MTQATPVPTSNARLLAARFLFGALLPDRMLLQLVQNLRRADRDAVRISRHRPAAGLERVAPPELDRVERQRRAASSINTSSAVIVCSVP